MNHPAQPHRCVLVVDDDADIREVMQMILELHGYDVMVAADGAEALERLHSGAKPSLILLDLMMPGMNGLEFRAEQLQDPDLAKVPVVAVTGGGNIADEAGAEGLVVMRKPVEIHKLLDEIDRQLR